MDAGKGGSDFPGIGDFIGLGINGLGEQADRVGCIIDMEGLEVADHFCCPVFPASPFFLLPIHTDKPVAVCGKGKAAAQCCHVFHQEGHSGLLEGEGINQGKDPSECIMRRHAIL